MKDRTHLYKVYHYFRDIFQTGLDSLFFISGKFIFSLIFTITLLMFFFVVSEKTSAKNSIFTSDKQTQIINTPHNKLTQSVRLNKDVIYNDTLNKSSINFYYINNPKSDYTLYIKCPDETISQKYIQIFDSTYRELDYKLQKKSSYLCINLSTPLSDIPDKTCIYISIGSTSTSDNKIYILCTKTETTKTETTKNKDNTQKSNTQKFQNSHKLNSEKNHTTKHNTSNKSKTGNKIKKTQTNKNTIQKNTVQKHNIIKSETTSSNNTKINKATQSKTTHTYPVKTNTHKKKKHEIAAKKYTSKKNNKNHTTSSDAKKNIADRNKHKTNKTKNVSNNNKNKVNRNARKAIPKLQGISLSKHYILLKKGNSMHLSFTTQPANLRGCKYIWTTTNPKVASVSLGKITAKSTGLAVIKLKIIHNQVVKTSTCTVRVTQ